MPSAVVPLLITIDPLEPDVNEKPLPIDNDPLSPDTAVPLLNTIDPLTPDDKIGRAHV